MYVYIYIWVKEWEELRVKSYIFILDIIKNILLIDLKDSYLIEYYNAYVLYYFVFIIKNSFNNLT